MLSSESVLSVFERPDRKTLSTPEEPYAFIEAPYRSVKSFSLRILPCLLSIFPLHLTIRHRLASDFPAWKLRLLTAISERHLLAVQQSRSGEVDSLLLVCF